MTVYVDRPHTQFGRMVMCHMIADTTEELLAMADAVGVARKWIQSAGTYREHFDIAKSKRALALDLGAVAISNRVLAMLLARKRGLMARGSGQPVEPKDPEGDLRP